MESFGDSEQVEGRAVADTALDATHVAPADFGDIRKAFLGEAALLAQFTDASPQLLEGWMFGGTAGRRRHDSDAAWSHPLRPRPIGYNNSEEIGP
jgi:hypothetical protein